MSHDQEKVELKFEPGLFDFKVHTPSISLHCLISTFFLIPNLISTMTLHKKETTKYFILPTALHWQGYLSGLVLI